MQVTGSLPNIGSKTNVIIYGCIVGSRAHNTHDDDSDYDKKWVFVQGAADLYLNGIKKTIKISENEIAFELHHFVNLLLNNDPNAMEMLFVPDHCVLHKKQEFQRIINMRKQFITKELVIKLMTTAYGVINEVVKKSERRESYITVRELQPIYDFCYIVEDNKSSWLSAHTACKLSHRYLGAQIKKMGFTKIDKAPFLYNMFIEHTQETNYRGICTEENPHEIAISNVPSSAPCIGLMYFNEKEYLDHVQKYSEYQEMIERYVKNDPKTFGLWRSKSVEYAVRLSNIAWDICSLGEFLVEREEKVFLRNVKQGLFTYVQMREYVQKRVDAIKERYDNLHIPDKFTGTNTLRLAHASIRNKFSRPIGAATT